MLKTLIKCAWFMPEISSKHISY